MPLQFIANGICAGAIYAIVALGFGLIYNTTNVFHFAHCAVYRFYREFAQKFEEESIKNTSPFSTTTWLFIT
ncbi:hypothetical protein [Candidatus Kryptobacter tengchongensis]|uniref:hypothetical protein n=1 Tax=Kryptobacter tengchongensis TaxID=1643429 RepID=UPI000707DF25|nr:hypothetical protein [Candidatus Kryptobacter tengchongensis]CUS84767.1 hypothetical protein JGI20_00937 [Candidatus Kryptobacter tengchongensis]